jgi:hypothetical protein
MKRALVEYVVPMLLGVALVVALSATGAFANRTSSFGQTDDGR